MSSVGAIDPASRAAQDVLAAGVNQEGVLILLGYRINDMDEQIRIQTARLENNIAASKQFSERLEVLYALQGAVLGRKNTEIGWDYPEPDPASLGYIQGEGLSPRPTYESDLASFKANAVDFHGKLRSVKELADSVGLDLTDIVRDGKLTGKEIDSAIEKLNTELKKNNSRNELDMVTLQTSMQQRSESIQMFTNILRTMHECDQSIIQNMK